MKRFNCTWTIVSMAFMATVVSANPFNDIESRLDNLADQVETLSENVGAKSGLRLVHSVHTLDGNDANFRVFVSCDRAFRIESLVVVSENPNGQVTLDFTSAMVSGSGFWPDTRPNAFGSFQTTPFTTFAGAGPSPGFEIMSHLGVPPVGIPEGGRLEIRGVRAPNTHVTSVSMHATVESSRDASNSCEITVFDR